MDNWSELEKYVNDRAQAGYEAYCECAIRYQPIDLGDPNLQWDNLDGVVKLSFMAFAERVIRYGDESGPVRPTA